MKPSYTIGVPAKNEENTIRYMMQTLNQDVTYNPIDGTLETLVCVNGCEDDTEKMTKILKTKYPLLNIKIIESDEGLVNAQKQIISESNSSSDFVLFYNADLLIKKGSTANIINHLNNNIEALAVTGEKIALPKRNFWYEVFNMEALNPQLSTPDRKYLMGCCFGIRKESYNVPDCLVSDDMFLSYNLVYNNGQEAVQKAPEVLVFTIGPQTLKDYFNKRRRYKLELNKIFKMHPEFKKLQHYFKREINQNEVRKLSSKQRIQLKLHDLIKILCEKLSKLSNGSIWVPLDTTKDVAIYD